MILLSCSYAYSKKSRTFVSIRFSKKYELKSSDLKAKHIIKELKIEKRTSLFI